MYQERGDIRVELEHAGEGYYGEFQGHGVEDDEPLLRFWVLKFDGSDWKEIESASYCTQLPDYIPDEEKEAAMKIVMDKVYDAAMDGSSIKKICERLSWLNQDDLRHAIERSPDYAA